MQTVHCGLEHFVSTLFNVYFGVNYKLRSFIQLLFNFDSKLCHINGDCLENLTFRIPACKISLKFCNL